MKLAYFFDDRSSEIMNEQGHPVGHKYFATSSHVALMHRPFASWHLRHMLESTALKCRAALAISAGRVHMSMIHGRNACASGSTMITIEEIATSSPTSSSSSSSSGSGSSSHNKFDPNYYMELGEASPYPPITLSCLSEFTVLATDRPDLKHSLCRLIAQINATFG
jgi:hypothetical protein